MAAREIIALIGMPGGGKSSAGQALAKILKRRFVDLDGDIEKRAKKNIAAIFAEDGEEEFRRLESAALESALRDSENKSGKSKSGGAVVAAGGGIILSPKNRRRLRAESCAVYLAAPLPLLQKRLAKDSEQRPLLQKSGALAAMLKARESLYQQTAHVAVAQTAADSPPDVAKKIQAGLRHWLAQDSAK